MTVMQISIISTEASPGIFAAFGIDLLLPYFGEVLALRAPSFSCGCNVNACISRGRGGDTMLTLEFIYSGGLF